MSQYFEAGNVLIFIYLASMMIVPDTRE